MLTYNKKNDDSPKFNLDNSRTIKIKTQKRKESFLKSVNNIDNNLINEDNILKSLEQPKNNKYIDSTNRTLNLDVLKNIKINNEPQDENVFLNSINKSTILKVNLNSSANANNNNLPQTFDERGYLYNSNATYFDNDGVYFNEEGFDKNKGRHNRLGEYEPGPNFNNELGMYNDDINNLSFDKDTLKKEISDKENMEFEKIVLEGKESKKLQKNFQLPIEKDDDSSDDLNISDNNLKFDKSDESGTENELIENIKISQNKTNDEIDDKFYNGEFNEEIEKNLNEEENKDNNNRKINNEQIDDKDDLYEDKRNLNKTYKIKHIIDKEKLHPNSINSKKSYEIQIKDINHVENVNEVINNYDNITGFDDTFTYPPEYVEKKINKEDNIINSKVNFQVNELLKSIGINRLSQKNEFIKEINNLISKYK